LRIFQSPGTITSKEYVKIVRADLFRYGEDLSFRAFLRAWRVETGFTLTFWSRSFRFLKGRRPNYGLHRIPAWLYQRCSLRLGVQISLHAVIGRGIYLPHALAVVIHDKCVIGRNCTVSQSVTIGTSPRGDRAGTPIIGDDVFIGPGAVVFGAIRVGNRAAIGANCVVTRDVPDDGVVVGVPGRVISFEGSRGYCPGRLPDFD